MIGLGQYLSSVYVKRDFHWLVPLSNKKMNMIVLIIIDLLYLDTLEIIDWLLMIFLSLVGSLEIAALPDEVKFPTNAFCKQ